MLTEMSCASHSAHHQIQQTAASSRPGARQHLLDRLNNRLWQAGGFLRKLTLVSASAGYGKTTLVAEWLKDTHHPVAWLMLDDHDNDPSQFLAYLIGALQRVDAGLGRSVQALLQSPQHPPIENVLIALINGSPRGRSRFSRSRRLPGHPHSTIHDQLGFILDHQPRQMHLVVVTREDPLFPISRLRASGQVLEIRQTDLRFSTREIAEFFNRSLGLSLPAAVASKKIVPRVGWPDCSSLRCRCLVPLKLGTSDACSPTAIASFWTICSTRSWAGSRPMCRSSC